MSRSSRSRLSSMSERERRLALNEALLREVNERVEDMTKTFESTTGTLEIFCECHDPACTERFSVPTDVYERVRSDPTHVLVTSGHEDPQVKHVVDAYES